MTETPFNFDLERMKEAIGDGTAIRIPMGLSREERRTFISDRLKEHDRRIEASTAGTRS